jgi:hypothetical protein
MEENGSTSLRRMIPLNQQITMLCGVMNREKEGGATVAIRRNGFDQRKIAFFPLAVFITPVDLGHSEE